MQSYNLYLEKVINKKDVYSDKFGKPIIFYRGSSGSRADSLIVSDDDPAIFFADREHLARRYGKVIKSYYLKVKHFFDNAESFDGIIDALHKLIKNNPTIKWYKDFLNDLTKYINTINGGVDRNHVITVKLGYKYGVKKFGEVFSSAGYDGLDYEEDRTVGIFKPEQAIEIKVEKNESVQ